MRSSGATARSARAASAAAPSPSSGATAAAAAVAASASSSTCLRRSRRARRSCSSPASIPSVASTSASRASAIRDATASAFCVRTARRRRATAGSATPACVASALQLLGTAERVENVELEGRPRQPALLELAGHRDQPFGRRRDVFARHGPPPCIGARTAVPEDTTRDHEPGLVLRPQLRERSGLLVVEEAVGHVELGLDERL